MEQPFDDSTKNFYQRFFVDRGIQATTQHEVFSRSRSVDLLVECTADDLPKLQETIFAHFRRVNVLEFKRNHDPLTAIDFNLIMMRAWGIGIRDLVPLESNEDRGEVDTGKLAKEIPYWQAQEIAETPSQRTVTIVCVTRPQKLLDTLQNEFGFTATNEPGLYCNDNGWLAVWIIHPTELVLKPANYPLLSLAKGEKLEHFIELCISEGLIDYLQLTLDIGVLIDPDAIWHKIMELVNMEITIREETWPYIDEFFQKVPDALQKLPTLKDAFEEHARKTAEEAARKAAEEAEIRGEIRGEQRGEIRGEQRGEQRGKIQSHQQSLILILQHRFGELPQGIIEQISETNDLEKLAGWLEVALDIQNLEQFRSHLH